MWEVTSWKTKSGMEEMKAGRGPRNRSQVWLHMLLNATCRTQEWSLMLAEHEIYCAITWLFFFFFSRSGHARCYHPSARLIAPTSETAAALMATGGFWLFSWFNFGLKVISGKLLFSFCVETVRVCSYFLQWVVGAKATLAYNAFVYRGFQWRVKSFQHVTRKVLRSL